MLYDFRDSFYHVSYYRPHKGRKSMQIFANPHHFTYTLYTLGVYIPGLWVNNNRRLHTHIHHRERLFRRSFSRRAIHQCLQRRHDCGAQLISQEFLTEGETTTTHTHRPPHFLPSTWKSATFSYMRWISSRRCSSLYNFASFEFISWWNASLVRGGRLTREGGNSTV